jgi:hypothetical protein
MPERTSGALPLLPLSVNEKGRPKDEKPNKLLGGNPGDDNTDWVRLQLIYTSFS